MDTNKVKKALLCALLLVAALGGMFGQQQPDALESYRLGRDHENQNRLDEADAKYREAVTICQSEINGGRATIDTYVVLTWALQRQKKYNEVISIGREALKKNEDSRIVETMGEAYFYLGNFNESLQSMQKYINKMPNGERISVAYFFIGEIFRFQKKFHYADIAYTTAVSLTPGMALWWYRLGTVRESAGDLRFAREAYERALRIDPNYSQASVALTRTRAGA